MGSIKIFQIIIFVHFFFAKASNAAKTDDDNGYYDIGTGIADITGPAAGVVLNGYVNPFTLASGIHTRLFARSFIVQSRVTKKSVVFVSCDLGMFDHGLKIEVINKLNKTFGEKYTEKNVQISSTHTHSGPSGFMQVYAYLVIESYGFNPLTFWAIVDGIVESIEKADASLTRGRVYLNKGDLIGFNRNRSPTAYLENPIGERNLYKEDVDKEMIQLSFETVDESSGAVEPIGCFNWWPVHPVTFNGGDNPLVSSDSRGFASVTFDYKMNKGQNARPGRGKFVAAFVSANLGDVSANIPAPAQRELNMTEQLLNVETVGTGQFKKAFELFNDKQNRKQVVGPIDFKQQYVDMPNTEVNVMDGKYANKTVKLCKGAIGYAFLGLNPSDFWDAIRDSIKEPSEEMIECQKPKLIALPAGEMTKTLKGSLLPFNATWSPSIVDLNILRIGQIDIVSLPGEFTTMAGRRIKRAIEEKVTGRQVILSGLANNYINYIATPEEYSQEPEQEYESGATIFGKYTLNAIIQKHVELVNALNTGSTVASGPTPRSYIDQLPKKIIDRFDVLPLFPWKCKWGDVVTQPREYVYAEESLAARFVTPSLRHNAFRNQSHFLIEHKLENGEWEVVRTDADLDTTFWWNKIARLGEIRWKKIPRDIVTGTYRVFHQGYYMKLGSNKTLTYYSNYTREFKIYSPGEAQNPGNGVGVTATTDFVLSSIIFVIFRSFTSF